MEKYKLLDKEILEKNHVYFSNIKITCMNCKRSWVISLDPGRALIEKDLLCSHCFAEKYYERK